MKCLKCNSPINHDTTSCAFCFGKKELDWIESVFGVDKPTRIHNSYQGKIRYDTNYKFPSKW